MWHKPSWFGPVWSWFRIRSLGRTKPTLPACSLSAHRRPGSCAALPPNMLICDLDRELVNREPRTRRHTRNPAPKHDRRRSRAIRSVCNKPSTRTLDRAPRRPPTAIWAGELQELPVHNPRRAQSVCSASSPAGRLMELNPDAGTRVEQGQLRTYFGKGETFMQLVLRTTLQWRHTGQTQFDYLVCINEIDIRVRHTKPRWAKTGTVASRYITRFLTRLARPWPEVQRTALTPAQKKGSHLYIRTEFPTVAANRG